MKVICYHGAFGLGAASVAVWLPANGQLSMVARCPKWVSFDEPADHREDAAWVGAAERSIAASRIVTSADSVFVPLGTPDAVLGCLHLRYRPGDVPTANEHPSLVALAELGAAALDRTQAQEAANERQSFLLNAWTEVAEAGGYADTLRRLASAAIPRLADLCLIDVKGPVHGLTRMAAVHADPAMAAYVAELGDRYPPEAGGPHPANEAMREGRSLWSATMPDDFLRATTRDERHFELVKLLGFQSYMSVPLIAGGEVLGAVTLVSGRPERRFGQADVALAEQLASRAARVVANARQRDREHALVHELQRLLLPERLPYSSRMETAVRYLTAAAEAEAGGDFYDVVVLPSDRLGFMIGDVEGHDAMAAAFMGQLRSASRALAGQVREPAGLVDALRWSWDLLGFGRTATAIFGRIDPSSGDTVMASAGHLPPALVDREGGATLLDVPPSPPLGVGAEGAVEYRCVLDEGATLFLYTDGLVEHRDSSLDVGLKDLVSFLATKGQTPLEQLCDEVLAALAPPGPRQDDVAVLALRRLELPGHVAGRGTLT